MHDPVRVTTTCERVGTKSLTLFQQLLAGGEVRSESRSVMVVFDFARQRSEPVPDAWRERLLADQRPAVRRCAVSAGRGGHNTYSLPPRG